MSAFDDVVKVIYRWDDQPGVTPGWYCETLIQEDDGTLRQGDDSQKIWFPLTVDYFGEDQEVALVEALKDKFGDAEIERAS